MDIIANRLSNRVRNSYSPWVVGLHPEVYFPVSGRDGQLNSCDNTGLPQRSEQRAGEPLALPVPASSIRNRRALRWGGTPWPV